MGGGGVWGYLGVETWDLQGHIICCAWISFLPLFFFWHEAFLSGKRFRVIYFRILVRFFSSSCLTTYDRRLDNDAHNHDHMDERRRRTRSRKSMDMRMSEAKKVGLLDGSCCC